MKLALPPGIPFLFYLSLAISAPPLLTFAAVRALDGAGILRLPPWAVTLAIVLSAPLFYASMVWRVQRRYHRAAARMGAVLPPELGAEGKWRGNFALVRTILACFTTGYPSDMTSMGVEAAGTLYQYTIFWATEYHTQDPNVIKAILATSFTNFEKGAFFKKYMHSLLGTGVFNSDGEMWKFHRSMSRPYFTRDRISHFDIFERHSEQVIQKMKERFRSGLGLDFQDLISRFTLDSATEFLFGACVDTLESTLPFPHNASPFQSGQEVVSEAEKFARAFADAQFAVASRPRLGWLWPADEILRSKTDKSMAVVNSFIEPIIHEALRKQEKRAAAEKVAQAPIEEDDSETLLDHLVRATSDRTVLRDETLNILLAGRDTTAATLTFTIYLLAQHPTVLQRLRAEILEHVGPTRRPTYDDIRDMKYLRAVLNETLRLYPSVPMNVRFAIKDGLLPNPDRNGPPIFVPAGTAVSYSVFNMHREPAYWGPTAGEYDPDRWIDERVTKYLVANPFIFLPFNGGPRICLGQQFAYNEMSFFLIRLLQSFSDIALDATAQPPESRPPAEWAGAPGRKGAEVVTPKLHITLYVDGGLWVKMREAAEPSA